MKTIKFPGWRTMTSAQRYNAKMFRMSEEAKELNKKYAPFHAYQKAGGTESYEGWLKYR